MGSNRAKLLIVGAGGHGKSVADIAECTGAWTEIAFVDQKYPALSANGRWPVIADQADLAALRKRYPQAVVAVGDAAIRLKLLDELKRHGFELPAIRHPASVVASDVTIGEGAVIMAGAVINIGARVGRGCIVNTGACIDHDCVLGEGVHVCPGVRLAGEVAVGDRAWIGIGAVVIQQRKIGRGSMVGAGAVVIRDVEDQVTVVGVPAKILKGPGH
jgi:sugar O-acyltransferase (sialic acid O-acetyltransferase NeuD family)